MIIQGKRDFLVEKASSFLAMAVQVFASVKQQVVLGVAGGEVVSEVLVNLSRRHLPRDRIHLFLLEEILASSPNPEGIAQQIILSFGDRLHPEMIHSFPGCDDDDFTNGAEAYLADFERLGGSFDLILVSCGEDGRIASLYPNHRAMECTERAFLIIDDAPEPPLMRMVASSELLRKADTGVLLAFGEEKRASLTKFFDTYLSEVECPAKLITKLHRYYLLTDQDIVIP